MSGQWVGGGQAHLQGATPGRHVAAALSSSIGFLVSVAHEALHALVSSTMPTLCGVVRWCGEVCCGACNKETRRMRTS